MQRGFSVGRFLEFPLSHIGKGWEIKSGLYWVPLSKFHGLVERKWRHTCVHEAWAHLVGFQEAWSKNHPIWSTWGLPALGHFFFAWRPEDYCSACHVLCQYTFGGTLCKSCIAAEIRVHHCLQSVVVHWWTTVRPNSLVYSLISTWFFITAFSIWFSFYNLRFFVLPLFLAY